MPSLPYPTQAEIAEARTASDWAGIEVRDRDPRGECCDVLRASAVRALRQGRPAYLCLSWHNQTGNLWASIACDHGEEIADDWFFGRAPKEVHDFFGGGSSASDFGDLLRIRGSVKVIDHRHALLAAE